MRSSNKRSITGPIVVGALAFSAPGAYAAGGGNANGPDAFIGIVGGNPGYAAGGARYYSPANPGPEAGDAHRSGHGSYGGNGAYGGGYYRGY